MPRKDGVHRVLQRAVGAVLETDGHGESARHLSVGLAFGRACSYGDPGDQIAHVLRHDGIQELRAAGKAHGANAKQDRTREREPLGDVARAVEAGIADEALPSGDRARLLEVRSHDDEEVVLRRKGHLAEPLRVLERCFRVVDRAGADDDHQFRSVPAVNQSSDVLATRQDERPDGFRKRQIFLHLARRNERRNFGNSNVFDLRHGGVLQGQSYHLAGKGHAILARL